MKNQQGYCTRCNRNENGMLPKGKWTKTDMLKTRKVKLKTTRGIKSLLKGTCSKCGARMTKMVG